MHHDAQGGPRLVRSAQHSFVPIRWSTRQFCMFVMDDLQDGAQCHVVSLAAIPAAIWHLGTDLNRSSGKLEMLQQVFMASPKYSVIFTIGH